MTSASTLTLQVSPAKTIPTGIRRIAAVTAGALLMTWPALYNRFPLLYPDSMTYLGDGPVIARRIFLHQSASYYGMRSFFYSLGILPLHWNITAWPIVAAQALLIAYVLWLVVRSILPQRTVASYLALMTVLSSLTTLSWYASIIMPDILGPALYLAFYLLVFAPETMSWLERLSMRVLACWGVTAHATHMMLAVSLCAVVLVVMLLKRWPMWKLLRAGREMVAIIAVAALAQLAMYGYFYGKVSLNGERPPYLLARVLADGTGRDYLQQYCSQVSWTICTRIQYTTGDADHFLWDSDGGWGGASPSEQKSMRQEEIPFVLATLRAFPKQQISKSMEAFRLQLQTFGIEDLDPSSWVAEQFDEVLPGARGRYLASRQANNTLHIEEFTALHIWVVRASLVAIVALLPFVWRRVSSRLTGLAAVILCVVITNAFVTGAMSMVDERYGSRVIWMVPFLIGLVALERFTTN